MRKIARVPSTHETVRRVMVFPTSEGVYLFLYDSLEDGPCMDDELFKTLAEVDALCKSRYGIGEDDWEYIADPKPGCQHDWIAPVLVKRDCNGNPIWGAFESLQ